MVAYADHGVVVFDRPDGTTKQHWPRHRARARVVYCSRPPNTHLTTHLNSPTSLLRRHHLLLNSPTGATARGSLQPFHYICRVAFVHSSDKTQHSTHSLTHSLTLLRVVATGRAHAGPRTSTVRRSELLLSSLVVHDTFTNKFSRGYARRSSRRPNLHSGRWV